MEEKRDYSSYGWYDAATDEDIINTAIRQAIENTVNTASIARITAINENKVDVELLNKDKLINVPVCVSSFNGWTISLPLKENDMGIVIFTKYEISEYKESGNFQGESLSPFSQNNGLFIPFALFNQPAIAEDIIITNDKVNLIINKDNEITMNNEKANVFIDKNGGIAVTCESDVTIETQKDISVTCNNASIETKGDTEVKATGQVKVSGAAISLCDATAAQGVIAVGSPCPLTGTHSKGSSKVFAPGI